MQYKSPEGLSSQLSSTEQRLGSEFFPNDEKRAEVLDMDIESIKNKYPYRYEQYIKLIKEAKGNGTTEEELISIRKYIALINNLENYIASYEKDRPEGFLREHQQDVFHSIAEFLNKGHKAGYLDLPTGFGKTVLFVELVKALSKGRENKKTGLKTLVLVPTQDLVVQTIGKAEKPKDRQGFARFAPDVKVTAYYEHEQDLSGEVVVSTYKSFIILQKQNPKFTEQFDVVILDEAHKALGEVTKEQVGTIAPSALKIGCTATSEYSEGRSVVDILPELIHKMEVREAVELGILANPRGFLYRTNIKIEGQIGNEVDYPASVFRELNKEARNKVTVDFVKTFVGQGIKGLVPCLPGERGQHARDIAERICAEIIFDKKIRRKRNIIARSITQDTSSTERDETYEAFKRGEIDCLTYIDIITTGKDLPNAKFLVRNRPRRSKVESTQEIGRLLRIYEAEDPYIVEIEDEFPSGAKPYTIFDLFEVEAIHQGKSLVPSDEIICIDEVSEEVLDQPESEALVSSEDPAPPTELTIQPSGPQDPESIDKKITKPPVVTPPKEKKDKYEELTRQLISKMKVEAQLIRELSKREIKNINYENADDLKLILFESYPRIVNLATCGLMVFMRTRFGPNKFSGKTILKHFGSHQENTKNLNELLKFVGVVVPETGKAIDYLSSVVMTKLLSSGPLSLNELVAGGYNNFKSTKFGGKDSGLIEVTGNTILRKFGSGLENTENLNNLYKFIGLEVTPKIHTPVGKEINFSNKEHLTALLSSGSIDFKDLVGITKENFFSMKFGGGKTGFAEVSGYTILHRFSSNTDAESFRKLLKFVGLETKRSVNYSKKQDLVNLLNTQPGDLKGYGIKNFFSMKFGGGDSEFNEVSGKTILRNFGTGMENTENLSQLLKFLNIK